MKNELKIKNPKAISIDSVAKSIYITLSNNKVSKTVEKNNNMVVDYDHNGKVVGVELICLKSAEIHTAVTKSFSDLRKIIPALA